MFYPLGLRKLLKSEIRS